MLSSVSQWSLWFPSGKRKFCEKFCDEPTLVMTISYFFSLYLCGFQFFFIMCWLTLLECFWEESVIFVHPYSQRFASNEKQTGMKKVHGFQFTLNYHGRE